MSAQPAFRLSRRVLVDSTFFVGFVLAAAGYIVLCRKKLAVQTE